MTLIDKLVEENAGLIWSTAKKFYGINKEDLYQAGVLGIMKAYKNYRHDGNTKFSTYAYQYIFGEMYNLASNKDLRLSKDILHLLKSLDKAKIELSQELMREPTSKEIALYLEIDEAKISKALSYVNSIISMDDDSHEARNLHEVIGNETTLSIDDKLLLNDSIKSLSTLEQDIIKARYFEDLTQMETAKKLGITQVMVSRYEAKSLKEMHDYMYM